jgi:hypothetical protein
MSFTGNGTTLTLSTTTSIGRILSVGGFDEELPDVEDNDLSTSGHNEYIPGDLIDHGEVEFPVVFDPDNMESLGVVETGTITFPLQTGDTVAAKIAGTGYLKKRSMGSLENNQRAEGSYTWRFDGKTGPAYTPAT